VVINQKRESRREPRRSSILPPTAAEWRAYEFRSAMAIDLVKSHLSTEASSGGVKVANYLK